MGRPILLRGFTIVELLIVIVVIGILAAISLLAYNGIQGRARDASAESSAAQGSKKIQAYATTNSDTYPTSLSDVGISNTSTTNFGYSYNNSVTPRTFCLTATTGTISYYASNVELTPTAGQCSGQADGTLIQTITTANCSASRMRAVDARDNRTYWVQKLSDGKCWMLTNLAYAGGGTNTYSDIRTLTNATVSGTSSYTTSLYYVPTGANPTTEPTNPSTATNGTGQYGYLYNWCATMGGQATAACANATTPAPVATTTVCPAGWRLPTGNGGEYAVLNTAINGGLTNTDAGIRSGWLGQYGGYWNSGFSYQGTDAFYRTSTQGTATSTYSLAFASSVAALTYVDSKPMGFSVRCLAN